MTIINPVVNRNFSDGEISYTFDNSSQENTEIVIPRPTQAFDGSSQDYKYDTARFLHDASNLACSFNDLLNQMRACFGSNGAMILSNLQPFLHGPEDRIIYRLNAKTNEIRLNFEAPRIALEKFYESTADHGNPAVEKYVRKSIANSVWNNFADNLDNMTNDYLQPFAHTESPLRVAAGHIGEDWVNRYDKTAIYDTKEPVEKYYSHHAILPSTRDFFSVEEIIRLLKETQEYARETLIKAGVTPTQQAIIDFNLLHQRSKLVGIDILEHMPYLNVSENRGDNVAYMVSKGLTVEKALALVAVKCYPNTAEELEFLMSVPYSWMIRTILPTADQAEALMKDETDSGD